MRIFILSRPSLSINVIGLKSNEENIIYLPNYVYTCIPLKLALNIKVT